MCRLIAYRGPEIALRALVEAPAHSLMVQSYAPREMTSGVVNADGFGFAWYDRTIAAEPFVYKSVLPIWADGNLASLGSYVRAETILANVRSATPGQGTDWSNTHPFADGRLSLVHNGFVADFHDTLYRPLRQTLSDRAYRRLRGNTDSEHVFAAVSDEIDRGLALDAALTRALQKILALAPDTAMSLAVVVSDGDTVAAARLAQRTATPSLYWTDDDAAFPGAVVIASEIPHDPDSDARHAWRPVAENGLLTVDGTGAARTAPFLRAA